MRFGLFCSPKADSNDLGPETGQGFRDYLDFNVEAEALGFHSSFSVEHHFTGWHQVSATLMLLMALAMRTKTLRLGTAVIVLPWHNPVLLAEQVATLDLVSDGRVDFGIGKGYRHSEFKGFNIAPEEAEARFEEALALMRQAWTTRTRFSHHGRFWNFDDIVVEPPPAQSPHPPLWVAAGNPHSIKRAAQRGFNLILDQYASPATLGERIAIYKAERLASGLGFDPMQVMVARQLYIAKDRRRPRRGAQAPGRLHAAYRRGFARARREGRVARAGLCRQGRRHRRECDVRHTRRDRDDAGGIAGGRRRLHLVHRLRRQRAVAPFRARHHAGFRRRAHRARGGMT